MSPRVGVLAAPAVVALGLVLAGCGASGSGPTGPAHAAPQCPVHRISSKLTVDGCRSPDRL